ncbi:hypothetical protein BSKO_01616 [Bryopsis sp. KO-2023]|nr:hypothetical protein BSKO_01616 [Bryopsis sp. KO-2023]
MASGWLRGTVKAVLSGDTVIVMGADTRGPPPEKQITLSSLKAPRMGRRDGTTKDEPFAWESREFLRKKCIGQSCVFRTDYKVEQLGNREFGSVFLGKENLALSVVSAGWSKVNPVGTTRSPYFDELEKEQAAAESKELGVWSKDEIAIETAVRDLPPEGSYTGKDLLEDVGRGKPVTGIVEQVLNAGLLRVTLLDSFNSVVVYVAGVMAPKGRARAENGAEAPEPFFLQSKHFSEKHALNREVRIVLQDLDKYENLSATVYYPDGEEPKDLGQELLKNGFAKVFDRGVTAGSTKLRELERTAKQEKRGMWSNYVPAATNSAKLSDQFTGKVVDVVSGDTVVVLDKESRTERRVQLSSLRAPKMGNPSNPAADWAVDAREHLRKLAIGKDVQVQMEYTRKITPAPGMVVPPERQVLAFGNVILKGKGGDINLAERVVANGWATLVRHNSDEERSSIYEALSDLEVKSREEKKGMHCGKAAPVHRHNDVSAPAPGEQKRARFIARAQGYLAFLQRAGKVKGTVEYVLSAQKLKIYVPKENVTIAFSPSGIVTPQRASPARDGQAATKGEPYGDEAVVFTREHVNQRDVEIVVETMNKGGTFLGTLTVPGPRPFDLSLGLIENGLAKLHEFYDSGKPGGQQLVMAQKLAKEKNLKIWQHHVEEAAVEDANGSAASTAKFEPQVVPNVTVTEVVDGNSFYVQILGEDSKIESITEQLKDPAVTEAKLGAPPPKGSACVAKFTLDDLWYRGYVQGNRGDKVDVYFTDYGNSEQLPAERVRPMDPSLAPPPPQAHLWQLAYIKVPSLEKGEEYAYDSAGQLSSLVGGGKKMKATVVLKEKPAWGTAKHPRTINPKCHVVLSNHGEDKDINAQMLESGFARLPVLSTIRNPHYRAATEKYEEHESVARKQHRGIFVYGDPGDSDDDMDNMPVRGRR